MREQHLRVRQKRRFVPRSTVADKAATPAPNHLLQRSSPQRLNEVWVTASPLAKAGSTSPPNCPMPPWIVLCKRAAQSQTPCSTTATVTANFLTAFALRAAFCWLYPLRATLKAECFGSSIPATRTQARSMVFDCIENFHNPVRLHSALGF